ncbi:MAG: hypothetical protein IPJ88_06335 [Myxococcales bacterium]|nr:MAG: hypothetical protein IPJ88_06335 [Myxococcales bacterium]
MMTYTALALKAFLTMLRKLICFSTYFVLASCGITTQQDPLSTNSEASIYKVNHEKAAEFFRENHLLRILIESYSSESRCEFNLENPQSILTSRVEDAHAKPYFVAMLVGQCKRNGIGVEQVIAVTANIIISSSWGIEWADRIEALQAYRGVEGSKEIYVRRYDAPTHTFKAEQGLNSQEQALFTKLSSFVEDPAAAPRCITTFQHVLLQDGQNRHPTDVSEKLLALSSELDNTSVAPGVALGTIALAVRQKLPDIGTIGEPSKGCGIASVQTGVLRKTITVGNIEREYELIVPENYDAEHAYPLLFTFHGVSGAQGRYIYEDPAISEAEKDAVIFVHPQALEQEAPGQEAGFHWRASKAIQDQNLAFFDALLEELTGTMCINTGHIGVSGFSAGGGFASLLGYTHSRYLSMIAPLAPYMPEPFDECDTPPRVFVGVGDGDRVNSGNAQKNMTINASAKELRDEVIQKYSCEKNPAEQNTDLMSYHVYHDCSEPNRLMFCEAFNTSHTTIAGDTEENIYGKAIYDFFMAPE